MRIDIPDFDAVETGFEAVPPNTYTLKCTGCEVKTGKVSNAKYLSWEFTIEGPDHQNRKLYENTGLTEKGLPFTKKYVIGCGVKFDNTGFATEDCLGKRVSVVVDQATETYEGKDRTVNSFGKMTPLS